MRILFAPYTSNVTAAGVVSTIQRFEMPRLDQRWIGWWYIAIGIGFVLLAIVNIIAGGRGWLITLRFVLAGGFGFLGWTKLHESSRKP